ncbi:MAG: ATP-binding protein [Bacteroidales bacterium]|nr:ATP-binding protein [Bacteroidales bacterium]
MSFLLLLSMAVAAVAAEVGELYIQYTTASASKSKEILKQLQKQLIEEDYLSKDYFTDPKYKGLEEAAVLMGVSAYFYYTDEWAKAEEPGLKAIALLGNVENDLTSDTYSTLSCAAHRTGNLVKALDYMQKCLAIDTKMRDTDRMSSDLNNITATYLAMEEAKSAETYILKAINLQREVDAGKPSKRMGIELGMASEVYLKLKQFDKALDYAQKAFANDAEMGETVTAAVRQCQVAGALYELGRYDDAEKELRQALPVLKQNNKKNSLAICYAQLADVMKEKHSPAEAEGYYMQALQIFKALGNRYLERRCEKGLSSVLRTKDPAAALKHLERYCVLADSIYNEESARQSNIFNAKYKNEELAKQNAEIEATNRTFRITLIASIIGLILLIAAATALYVAFKHKSRAHDMAKQLEQVRTSFFTNITHEFRTPLTVILGASERLLKGSLAPDEKPEKLYGMISRQGQGLLRLINQLLDISKVNSEIGNPDWRHGDVVPYLSMIVNTYEDAAYEKGVQLHFAAKQKEIAMDFVPGYMQKILSNLISNAVKFTAQSGFVAVAVEVKNQDICIRVADNGRGIPKEELESVFEAFHQASNAHDKVGTGVGLALVKQIVSSMRGEISVSSTPGKGTVFSVLLPLDQQLKTPARALSSTEMTVAKEVEVLHEDGAERNVDVVHADAQLPSVLVVEDDKDISYYIGSQLQSKYNVYFATNGEEGFAMASEIMPSLIISDVMMPVCDGFEFCQRLHQSEVLNHIPVIILTAKTDDRDRIKALQVGVDNFMNKPFNSEELALRVDHLIAQREVLRQKFSQALAQGEGKEKEVEISQPEREFLDRLDALILQRMGQADVDIDSIASALCMSRKQLRSKVSSITGETPSTYIQHLRMGKACEMLTTTDVPIGEIAMQCGFDDSAYFSRIFKQLHGVTPSQYRKK